MPVWKVESLSTLVSGTHALVKDFEQTSQRYDFSEVSIPRELHDQYLTSQRQNKVASGAGTYVFGNAELSGRLGSSFSDRHCT